MAAAPPTHADVLDRVRRGRDLLRQRRYAEAASVFEAVLAEAPDDPEAQALSVTAEFWRRLARDGDGLPLPPPVAR
jgi:Flp pilus assembly protein TadD